MRYFLDILLHFFYNLITSVIDAPDQMAMQVVTVFIGVIITSLGISMYQLPKQGVAHIQYFSDHDREMAENSVFLVQSI